MNEVKALFDQAYELYVVEEQYAEAIALLRKGLTIHPDHYQSLVLLGMLLSDFGGDHEQKEGRELFVKAIKSSAGLQDICNSGYEQTAVHHLGVWEYAHGQPLNALLFFLADVFLCKSAASRREILDISREVDAQIAFDIEAIISHVHTTD
jgi:tetratricopeptide (TPR) repeat protein